MKQIFYVAYEGLTEIMIAEFPTRMDMVEFVNQLKKAKLEIICVWVEGK